MTCRNRLCRNAALALSPWCGDCRDDRRRIQVGQFAENLFARASSAGVPAEGVDALRRQLTDVAGRYGVDLDADGLLVSEGS